MPRTQHSRKPHSTSFTKFVARLQRTFSYKNIKSSTPIIPQQLFARPNPSPVLPTFPSFSNANYPRCRLSQIIYDPLHHPVEYLSEIEQKTSISGDENDSCYDSMNEHQNDRFNLSQMNVSVDEINYHSRPTKQLQLPPSFDTARFHSTAINDIGHD